jgi:hypothetical protein
MEARVKDRVSLSCYPTITRRLSQTPFPPELSLPLGYFSEPFRKTPLSAVFTLTSLSQNLHLEKTGNPDFPLDLVQIPSPQTQTSGPNSGITTHTVKEIIGYTLAPLVLSQFSWKYLALPLDNCHHQTTFKWNHRSPQELYTLGHHEQESMLAL